MLQLLLWLGLRANSIQDNPTSKEAKKLAEKEAIKEEKKREREALKAQKANEKKANAKNGLDILASIATTDVKVTV